MIWKCFNRSVTASLARVERRWNVRFDSSRITQNLKLKRRKLKRRKKIKRHNTMNLRNIKVSLRSQTLRKKLGHRWETLNWNCFIMQMVQRQSPIILGFLSKANTNMQFHLLKCLEIKMLSQLIHAWQWIHHINGCFLPKSNRKKERPFSSYFIFCFSFSENRNQTFNSSLKNVLICSYS